MDRGAGAAVGAEGTSSSEVAKSSSVVVGRQSTTTDPRPNVLAEIFYKSTKAKPLARGSPSSACDICRLPMRTNQLELLDKLVDGILRGADQAVLPTDQGEQRGQLQVAQAVDLCQQTVVCHVAVGSRKADASSWVSSRVPEVVYGCL